MTVTPTFRRSDLTPSTTKSAGGGSATTEATPLYVLIQNKVYEVRDFVKVHPGGKVLLTHTNGEDATGRIIIKKSEELKRRRLVDAFAAFHPPSAYETLADFYVGDLAPEDHLEPSEAGKNLIEKTIPLVP